MHFRLVETHEFWWPVTVRLPDPDKPGSICEQTFEARFKAISRTDAKALDEAFARLETVEQRRKHEDDMLRGCLIDWRNVEDGAGQPVAFSATALEAAMDFEWFRRGAYEALARAMRGEEAKVKN